MKIMQEQICFNFRMCNFNFRIIYKNKLRFFKQKLYLISIFYLNTTLSKRNYLYEVAKVILY